MCGHVFCAVCLEKNKARYECNVCLEPKRDSVLNKFAIDLIESLEPFKYQSENLLSELDLIQKNLPENMQIAAGKNKR